MQRKYIKYNYNKINSLSSSHLFIIKKVQVFQIIFFLKTIIGLIQILKLKFLKENAQNLPGYARTIWISLDRSQQILPKCQWAQLNRWNL